jgi:CubicO group peptidase (beta-lactamase class C family)
MKRIALITLTFFCLIACSAQGNFDTKSKGHILDKTKIENKVDALVNQYLDLDIFSGVVLVAEKGEPFYHKAFGLADREKNIKNTTKTKFDIGSMNKTFTHVVILQLVQEGKLKLSDKLSSILPDFSGEMYSEITIDHLLNHSAGFGDYFMTDGYFELPLSQKNIKGLIKIIKKMPLLYEPGTEREYSNAGFIVLGAVIEHKTNKTYHQNVKDRIGQPLGLNDTYFMDKKSVPNRAIGYLKTMRGELEDNSRFEELPNPDGGFQSTALDVMKFYREYHYGHKLLTEETKLKDEFYGMTVEHRTTGGAIPFAGGFNGSNSVIFEILRDEITIVVLANMDEPVAEQLGSGILDIIRDKPAKEPSLPAIQNVYKAYTDNGIDYVKANFNSMISNFHPTDPKGIILNQIGYSFLSDDKIDNAIEVFQLNTEMFPDDPNVWDSLGEAYLKKGNKDKALKMYKKALSIDPNFPSAMKAVKQM